MASGSGNHDNQDWQVGRSVLDCNKYMWEHKVATDVSFHIVSPEGCNVTVTAHKFVLVSRSPVFFAMFCGPLAESSDVQLKDIEVDAFQELLRWDSHLFVHIYLTADNVYADCNCML